MGRIDSSAQVIESWYPPKREAGPAPRNVLPFPVWAQRAPAKLDPMDWIESHPAEIAKHRGEWIVVHPVRGIIAAGGPDDVGARAQELDPNDETLLWYVGDFDLTAAPMF